MAKDPVLNCPCPECKVILTPEPRQMLSNCIWDWEGILLDGNKVIKGRMEVIDKPHYPAAEDDIRYRSLTYTISKRK